jgi:hypothetical protein
MRYAPFVSSIPRAASTRKEDTGQASFCRACGVASTTWPSSHPRGAAIAVIRRSRTAFSSADNPSAKKGDELTVEFTVLGQAYLGLNGGPKFKPNESVSFVVLTDNQEETDRYWDAIVGNGDKESQCGWCKDPWGFS